MFYESERIVNKQLKYEKSRAYEIIQQLESRGLDDDEIISCLNLLMKEEVTEFLGGVLQFALKTVTLRQESPNAVEAFDSSYSFIDGRLQCKVVSEPPAGVKKRKAQRRNKN